MADREVARLRRVRDDLDLTRRALAYTLKTWDTEQAIRHFNAGDRDYVEKLAREVGTTYFLRLTAEFEAVLKDYLRTNHPNVTFPARKADWKVDWFLRQVLQRSHVTIDPALRARLGDVRDYRNSLGHGDGATQEVTFEDALKAYARLVGRLP